ncbi:MAG TPA: hypothetical protein VF912_17565 [Anaeromyxobacter sp.]
MTRHVRLAALAVAANLAACGSKTATPPGLLLNEPAAVAVFRGVTSKHGVDPANPVHPYHPYLAIANAGGNDLSIVDAVDDSLVDAPVPLRGLVYPVPARPMLLASGDLGDRKPDLLVAVSSGDSSLQIIRTWAADGAVEGEVDLGGDILALVALPFDPGAPGAVKIAAALAGERIAVVAFTRSSAGDGTGIDVTTAQGSVATSGALGFQPVDLAATPGVPGFVWAATRDDLGGGVHGAAGIDVASTPFLAQVLDARAPTRLVAAARLAERGPGAAGLDPATWATTAPAVRVYAVLDESGCGLYGPIDCGLVALDPAIGGLAAGLAPAGPTEAAFRPPIPIVAGAFALAAAQPPFAPPSAADPIYAGTFLRVATNLGARASTAAAAVAGADGAVSFVDLGRWELPSQQVVHANVKATLAASQAPGSPVVDQWLVIHDPGNGTTVSHADPTGLSSAVTVTPGYTPTDRWTVTHEGLLPGLASRRAESGDDGGAPWLALQVHDGSVFSEVVRLFDPTLGVHVGDTVVIDATGLGTCATFEASVAALSQPDTSRPGGAVRLAKKLPTNAAWDACVDALVVPGAAHLLASVRAGGYVLVRGTGASAIHVGRPALGAPFAVAWQDEATLATTCLLPPAQPWPATPGAVASCPDSPCRSDCEDLVRARLARRVGYVTETCGSDATCLARWPGLPDVSGPALAFTLALETAAAPPRDLALVVTTSDGRVAFRVVPPSGSPVDPRGVTAFDRSPWSPASGVRFLVPFAAGLVLDTSPTLVGGGAGVLH